MQIDNELMLIFANMDELLSDKTDTDLIIEYLETGYNFIDEDSQIDFTSELEEFVYEADSNEDDSFYSKEFVEQELETVLYELGYKKKEVNRIVEAFMESLNLSV
jgi:Holliday junction resolvasome RuvABC DNA-binding subunit